MMNHAAAVSDLDADSRWRDWQARGAARDRRGWIVVRRALLVIGCHLQRG